MSETTTATTTVTTAEPYSGVAKIPAIVRDWGFLWAVGCALVWLGWQISQSNAKLVENIRRTDENVLKIAEQSRDSSTTAAKLVAVEVWKAAKDAKDATAYNTSDHIAYAARVSQEMSLTAQRISAVEAAVTSMKDGQLQFQSSMTRQMDRLEAALARKP